LLERHSVIIFKLRFEVCNLTITFYWCIIVFYIDFRVFFTMKAGILLSILSSVIWIKVNVRWEWNSCCRAFWYIKHVINIIWCQSLFTNYPNVVNGTWAVSWQIVKKNHGNLWKELRALDHKDGKPLCDSHSDKFQVLFEIW
jgi:hypothetical protein